MEQQTVEVDLVRLVGEQAVQIHALRAEVARLQAEFARLQAPASPNGRVLAPATTD